MRKQIPLPILQTHSGEWGEVERPRFIFSAGNLLTKINLLFSLRPLRLRGRSSFISSFATVPRFLRVAAATVFIRVNLCYQCNPWTIGVKQRTLTSPQFLTDRADTSTISPVGKARYKFCGLTQLGQDRQTNQTKGIILSSRYPRLFVRAPYSAFYPSFLTFFVLSNAGLAVGKCKNHAFFARK